MPKEWLKVFTGEYIFQIIFLPFFPQHFLRPIIFSPSRNDIGHFPVGRGVKMKNIYYWVRKVFQKVSFVKPPKMALFLMAVPFREKKKKKKK